MITRRRLIGSGLALSGALATACGSAGGPSLPAKQVRSGLTLAVRSYVNNQPLLAEIDKIWAAKHPQIKLSHSFSMASEILQKLSAEIAAATPPDVSLLGYRDVPAVQRHLLSLEPYMKRDKYSTQDFVPAAINQYKYGNSYYALPNSFPVRVGVYNASLFRERGVKLPPATWDGAWTWDEHAAAVRAVTGARGADQVWGMSWDKAAGAPNLLQVMLFCNNNGGAFLREDGKECLVNQPRGREALQYMQDLIVRHQAAPAPATLQQPNADLFVAGKAAWGSFGPASVAAYRRQLTFEWALGPLPVGPGAKQRTTIMDGSAWMAPRDGANKEEAWELVQTLVSPEYERAAGELQGYVPARRPIMAEYAGTEPPKNAKIMLEASERTYLLPKTPWAAEAETASAPLLRELWDGTKNANTVADEVKRLLDPILQKEFSFRTD